MLYTYRVNYQGEEFWSGKRDLIGKGITRILQCKEYVCGGEIILSSQETDADGNIFITISVNININLTPEQIMALENFCTHPELWIPEVHANRWGLSTDPVELTELLELAVPNKGLMYYGEHKEVGFNSLVPLNDEEKALAVEAFASYGEWK